MTGPVGASSSDDGSELSEESESAIVLFLRDSMRCEIVFPRRIGEWEREGWHTVEEHVRFRSLGGIGALIRRVALNCG